MLDPVPLVDKFALKAFVIVVSALAIYLLMPII